MRVLGVYQHSGKVIPICSVHSTCTLSMHVIADLISITAALHKTEVDAHKLQAAPWLDTHTAAVVSLRPSKHTACASASCG